MIKFEVYSGVDNTVLDEIYASTTKQAKMQVYEKYEITRLNMGPLKPRIRPIFKDPNENKREVLEKLKYTPLSEMRSIFCEYHCDFIRNYKYKELSTAYILENAFKVKVDFNVAHKGDDANGKIFPNQINDRIEIKSSVTNDESKLIKCRISFDKQSNEIKRESTRNIGCLVISLFRFSEFIYPEYVVILDISSDKHDKWKKFIRSKQNKYLEVNKESKGLTSRRWQPMSVSIEELYNTFQKDLYVVKYFYEKDMVEWTTIDELEDRYAWTEKKKKLQETIGKRSTRRSKRRSSSTLKKS